MRLWRLVQASRREHALDGEGAARYPGRWNQRGTRMLYTATSPSLAVLEVLAHVDPEDAPAHFILIELDIPGDPPPIVASLPDDWRELPSPESTQRLGSSWARKHTSLTLSVPSVHLPVVTEFIVLINPEHPDAPSIARHAEIPFVFDGRLL